jgi:uncharacterized membrane protein YedE/YeeE
VLAKLAVGKPRSPNEKGGRNGAGPSCSQAKTCWSNPAKVLNFLDIAGNWDPSLAFVMAGAIAVALPGYRLVLRRQAPLLSERFRLPTRTLVNARLVLGAGVFGVGWGLGGF